MSTAFVDRVESLAILERVAEGVLSGQGGVVAIDGASGMGKSALLDFCADRARSRGPLAGKCRVVQLRCSLTTTGTPFHLAADALAELANLTPPKRNWFRMFGQATVRAAPAVAGMLVPGLAPAVELGQNVAAAALGAGSMPADSLRPQQQAVISEVTAEFLSQAQSGQPVLLLIDDVQHIDLSSLEVLDRLVSKLGDVPLVLVLSRTTNEECVNAIAVAELLARWERYEYVVPHELPALPPDAVRALLRHDRPQLEPSLTGSLARRLSEATGGSPVFLRQCLRLLPQRPADHVSLPSSMPQAVRRRFVRLDEKDQELLVIAATYGSVFLSRVVAAAWREDHGRVMERLRSLASTCGMISEVRERPGWVRRLQSDQYVFEHQALRLAIRAEQTETQCEQRHAALADALREITDEASSMPHELRLMTAHLLRGAGHDRQLDSAAVHYALARETALAGLSFVEAEQHCAVAIRAARALDAAEFPERDRRFVEAVELLLSLTEVRWRGHLDVTGELDIDTLAEEAEAAAARLGDRRLIARTTLLRGKTLLVKYGLDPSLDKLAEAVRRAAEADDPVSLFVAKVEYGRQLPKRDLVAGLRLLEEAEELYASDPSLSDAENPVLQHARNLNEMQLGVNLFDSGRFGEARPRLVRCVERLRTEQLCTELPIALNYLAQFLIATGEFGEAERLLGEARTFEEERGADSGWHAYNTALLARLLAADPAQRDRARALVGEAWLETERTWLANLVPIVRNLHAEVLLELANADGRPAREVSEDLEEAQRLVAHTAVETSGSGMVRSEIAAHALHSRICLRRGEAPSAMEHGRTALRKLEEHGDLPALRTEEVLHDVARALHAAGEPVAADELVARARAVVRAKADSMTDARGRDRFLAEVPLNRILLSATPLSEG